MTTLAQIQTRVGVAPDGVWGPATARAIAAALGMQTASSATLTPSAACATLIKQFEGCRLTAYPDPGSGGDPWTIGVGTTRYEDGSPVRKGDVITERRAEELLKHDLQKFADGVRDALGGRPTTEVQAAAMISLAYNIGLSAFAGSTLLKLHKAGDYQGAAAQFPRWNKAAGRVMAGLTRRREAERKCYLGLPWQ